MIITDADVCWSPLRPAEDDAPLGIDADAMIADEGATERFEAIIWWCLKILEPASGVHYIQLASGNPLDMHPSAPLADCAVVEKVFGVFVAKAQYRHALHYTLMW